MTNVVFDGKSQSASVSSTYGYGVSVNTSFTQSEIKSDYASVQEQTAIRAGALPWVAGLVWAPSNRYC